MEDVLLQIEARLWNDQVEALPGPLRAAVHFLRFVYAIVRDVLTTTLTLRAMGLVYITILSIVPMLALIFSALKGFGFHRSSIEPALDQALEPLGEKGAELTDTLIGFVDNVQGGLLAGVGLLLLMYTTVSMIRKIEVSLNYIWRVDSARSFVQRFGEYISVVIVGPVLMFTAAALIAALGSNTVVERLTQIQFLGDTAVLVGKSVPYLLVSLFFAMLYWFIPNTRVKPTSALIGGITGGVLWAFSGVLFATFVASSARNVTIYASFAVVIVALMWLYVSWLILLVGAQTAFYFQNPEYTRVGYRQLNVGNQVREQAALSLMMMVADAFRRADRAYTTEEIASRLRLPGILFSPVKKRLENAGLLEITSKDHLVPARDPSTISLLDIVAAMRTAHTADVYRGGDWPEQVDHIVNDLNEQVINQLEGKSIYDLLDGKARLTT